MGEPRSFNREIFAVLWNNHRVPTARIAETMGITRQAVSWHGHHMGLPSREKLRKRKSDPALLSEMWLAGVRSADIARHFGMAHRSCAITAAKMLGLPGRKRGASGRMNGGWEPNITLEEFLEARLGARMAEAARIERGALINAEMVDQIGRGLIKRVGVAR